MIDHLPEGCAITPKDETGNVSGAQPRILIFCTSLRDDGGVRIIAPLIEALPGILSWSVDLEDCDKVLRMVSKGMRAVRVIDTFRQTDFNIQEMSD